MARRKRYQLMFKRRERAKAKKEAALREAKEGKKE
jgi:hypothetical protein